MTVTSATASAAGPCPGGGGVPPPLAFTVFAPTDEAFAKLPQGTIEDLLKPANKDKLRRILTYHVVEGEVPAADVAGLDGEEVETLNGETFTVNVGDDGGVTLTDAAGNFAVTPLKVKLSR